MKMVMTTFPKLELKKYFTNIVGGRQNMIKNGEYEQHFVVFLVLSL